MTRILATAAVAALMLPGVATASTLVLDDFTVDQQAEDAPSGFANSTTVAGSFAADTRTYTANNGGVAAPAATILSSGFINNELSFRNGDDVVGTGEVIYSFSGIDLSGFLSFAIDLTNYDQEDETTDLTLVIDGESSAAQKLMASRIGTTYSFLASEFSAANLSSVNTVALILDNSTADAIDLSLDNFRAEVPLPAGAVLMLTGLAGLGLARRKAA